MSLQASDHQQRSPAYHHRQQLRGLSLTSACSTVPSPAHKYSRTNRIVLQRNHIHHHTAGMRSQEQRAAQDHITQYSAFCDRQPLPTTACCLSSRLPLTPWRERVSYRLSVPTVFSRTVFSHRCLERRMLPTN